MPFIYYPSTYGKGYSGGAYHGNGILVGGSKKAKRNTAVSIPGETAPPEVKKKIDAAEATGNPVKVSDDEALSWKDWASGGADVALAGLSAIAPGVGVPAFLAKKALFSKPSRRFFGNVGNFLSSAWSGVKKGYDNWGTGRGYYGGYRRKNPKKRGRFVKGSPEAIKYMEGLRALRKNPLPPKHSEEAKRYMEGLRKLRFKKKKLKAKGYGRGLLALGYGRGLLALGYNGGRLRLRKGSPEAKAYMAKLRAMRRKKRSGRGLLALGYY